MVAILLLISRDAHADLPPPVAASRDALTAALSPDTRSETLPGEYVIVTPEPFAPVTVAVDPVYKSKTSRAIYIYEKERDTGRMSRRAVLHFEPDDRAAAVSSARWIARFLRLHRDHFGRETHFPRGAEVADVWFAPTTFVTAGEGGETRDANVYIFAASAIKSPLELVRTVAHEWGHLTLPAARGYAEPEYDAAGYLGERLYMKWLLGDRRTAYPKDMQEITNAIVLYNARQVAPLMARWQSGGPTSNALDGDRAISMDYYIGAVLDSDRAFGSRLVGDALFTIADTAPKDFLVALSGAVADRMRAGLKLALPAWVPLKTGTCEAANGGLTLLMSGAKPLSVGTGGGTDAVRFRVTRPGWYKVSAKKSTTSGAGDATAVGLKYILAKATP